MKFILEILNRGITNFNMSNPTAKHRRRWNKVIELGCIPCLIDGIEGTPAGISHAHGHGYRDHDKVWGSCEPHHLYQHAEPGILNRHKNPIEFREKYGTDSELVLMVDELLKET